MSHDTALKRPALYNPALWSRDEVRTYYIARQRLLERFLDDFRREKPGTRPQHRLILGQRGMGKSTLLRRLAIGIDDDAELAGQWLPLIFPEEQYNVATLADFWLNCLDALGDFLEARGDIAEMQAIDAEVERLDRKDGEGALQTLLRFAKKLDRRLLLLVDNIDLIFERIRKNDWVLREALQEHPELLLVGASSRALEATYDYGAAFYDFFRIDELRGLSETEMRETIVALARQRGAEEVVRRVESDPGRLRVLHTLTGGNPRTAVLLYGVLLKGVDGDVRSDLEALLDEVTPLYKARFDELPAQAQQLLDKVALHWDPISARQAADALGWTVNLASAQLDRLVQAGVVEKVKAGSGKRMAFQVAERFFNIWYLMRASRRVRRRLMWLVEFLRVCFSSDELQRLARERLDNGHSNTVEAEYMLAICRAIGPAPISHALETRALACLIRGGRTRLEEVLDLSGEDSDLAPKAERMQVREKARLRLENALDPARSEILQALDDLPISGPNLLSLADLVEAAGEAGEGELRDFVGELSEDLRRWLGTKVLPLFGRAIAAGDMADMADVEGGEAAAIRYQAPVLGLLPRLECVMRNTSSDSEVEFLARQALKEDDSGALFWFALGTALDAQGERVSAIAALREALNRSPDSPEVSRVLGAILAAEPPTQVEAIPLLQGFLRKHPDDVDVKALLALALMNNSVDRDEIQRLARDLCAEQPDVPRHWMMLAVALFGSPEHGEEQMAAAKKACDLDGDPASVWMLANSLLVRNSGDEALKVARSWFDALAHKEEVLDEDVKQLLVLLRGSVVKKRAADFLVTLDASGAAERFRPAREALAAAAAGTAEILNGVAPEVRKPALDILAIIAPELVKHGMLSAPL